MELLDQAHVFFKGKQKADGNKQAMPEPPVPAFGNEPEDRVYGRHVAIVAVWHHMKIAKAEPHITFVIRNPGIVIGNGLLRERHAHSGACKTEKASAFI